MFTAFVGQSSLTLPSDMQTGLYIPLHSAGARILSNSWGVSSASNAYDSYSSSADSFMWTHSDSLLLFANGNNGHTGSGTVNPPATFKNGVGVGASLNDHNSWLAYGLSSSFLQPDSLASFSSKGPTADGRMKPDVLAPGWWTTSAAGELMDV